MNIGVVFPQTEIGADRGTIRACAQRVEELGFTHLLAYDHVLGADPTVYQGWDGPYDVDTTFHEPNVESFRAAARLWGGTPAGERSSAA